MTTMTRTRLAADDPGEAMLSLRTDVGDIVRTPLSKAEAAMLDDVAPWRTFRMYYGQPHYSGTYWSATEHAHVIYESRLELCRLLLADFAPDVKRIVAQPFLMQTVIRGKHRRHVPDYFLDTDDGPVVVDVKPRLRLDDPKVIETFAWVRHAVESKGWRFEIACEPPPVMMENVRYLAGYRRRQYVSEPALAALRQAKLDGFEIGTVLRRETALPAPIMKATLLHMLWAHELSTDLDVVLSDRSILVRRSKR